MAAATLLLLFALADTPNACTQPNLVTIEAADVPLTNVLRAIATQSSVNIGVRKGFEGRVSATLRCVKPRFALESVLSQVNGAYCQERVVLLVDRADRIACTGQLTIPPPARRVSDKHARGGPQE